MKFSLVLNRYHNCHVIIFSQYNISNVKLTSPNIKIEISRILYLREKEKSYKMAWETIVWKLVSLARYFVTELEDRNANHRRQYCYL